MNRLRTTFQSLRVRNYRLYFMGQTVSVTGTWMQRIGQAWLVLELSGSGTLLGITTALQFLPILVAGPWGGLIADRVDKRRLLLWTQGSAGVLGLALGILTATGVVRLWMVMGLALALGVVGAMDNPARQSFVLEMVGPDQVTNAVALNSVIVNAARAVGPALAGILIATVGIASSFLINAASYFAVVVALWMMRPAELQSSTPTKRGKGQLREGLRYVRNTPDLAAPLMLMGLVGMLAYEFQVVLPLLARYTFAGDAQTLGLMNSAMGVGAVLGGLGAASSLKPSPGSLLGSALAFGGLILVCALAPTLPMTLAALFALGVASILFLATANSLLQLRADPSMRGRVMALWGVAFMGTTPIGGPLVGWVAETAGPRFALGLGGTATVLGAVGLYAYLNRPGMRQPQGPAPAAVTASAARSAANTAAGKRGPGSAAEPTTPDSTGSVAP